MDGASQAVDVLALDPVSLGAQLAVAVQGFFVLFFVVSPILGGIVARQVGKSSTAVMVWSIGFLVLVVVNFGLNFGLRLLLPISFLSNEAIAVLSSVSATALALLSARYAKNLFGEYDDTFARQLHQKMIEEDMLPFDKRRQEWQKRREKARKR